MGKKKIVMALNEEICSQFRQMFIDNGRPRSDASVAVQNFMEKSLADAEENGFSPDMFFLDRNVSG
jgi:hypothetical protein